MPIAHVEESWQMAEFYNNKVLIFNLSMLSYVMMLGAYGKQ